jgi:hypothetical protein
MSWQMKCVGANDPPCARCAKVGRKCVVPPVITNQQAFRPHPSTENMNGLAHHDKSRPVAYPLTPTVDTRHESVPPMQWSQSHDYSGLMPNSLTPTQPANSMDMPLMSPHSSKQHWIDTQRPPMSALHHSYSYSSLASLDVAAANVHYVHPQIFSSDVNISSVSVPATPLQRSSTFSGSPQSRKLPSDEELSHLCKL